MNPHDLTGGGDACPIDIKAMTDRVGGDEELVYRLLQHFLEKMDDSVQTVRRAVAESESLRVERAAHKFRGAVATVSAQRLSEVLLEMEEAARQSDLPRVEGLLQDFSAEAVRVKKAVQDVLGQDG